MQATQLPTPIRQTYASLRVFAWNGFETPDLSWAQVMQTAGKDRPTIYRHLLTLANTGVTRWRTAGVGLIRLTFTDGIGGAENCLNFETTPAQILKNETSQKRDGDAAPVVSADGQPDTPVLPRKSAGRLKNETSQKRDEPLSLSTSTKNLKRAGRLKNETSQKRDGSVEVNSELFPIVEVLSEVCRMGIEANRSRLFGEAKLLSKAVPPPTPELVRQHYGGPGSFWCAVDWRGKKGEDPTPALIRETWGKWGSPPSARSKFKDFN